MSEPMKPGELHAVGFDGLGPVYYTCTCGACKAETVTLGGNLAAARRGLYEKDWHPHRMLGFCCPACWAFLESVPGAAG